MRGDTGFPVRIQYTKHGKVRFVGHRDVARAFERAFRIEQLPLAFSVGFNPHPKVSFGLALAVGSESDAEFLDFELTEPIDCSALPASLSAALPAGIEVVAAQPLADRAPALQEAVTSSAWIIDVAGCATTNELRSRAEHLLASPSVEIMRTRKGREVLGDIRPAILSLTVTPPTGDVTGLELELATVSTASARPSEILEALALMPTETAAFPVTGILRTHQWIERDGARIHPLDADERPDDAGVLPLEARAS
jgi:radical SAM-linked protein